MASQTETPVLDTLAEMTADSLARTTLDPKPLMLVRIAALVASDAPPLSYMTNLAVAEEAGVSREEVESVLVAIAPIVGTARVMSAGKNIFSALGLAIALAEEEEELEAEAALDPGDGEE